MDPGKNASAQKEFVRRQVARCDVPRDSLPYHEKFDELYREYEEAGFPESTRNDYWRLILRVCKQGGVKQENKSKLPPIDATEDEMLEVLLLLPAHDKGRDRLPYTKEFDDLYTEYKRRIGRDITKNGFWRLWLMMEKTGTGTDVSVHVRDLLIAMNPWWNKEASYPIPDFRRNAFQKLYDSLLRGLYPIIALRGPRQVGKTTLLRQIIHDLLEKESVAPNHILRIQFDLLASLDIPDPIVTLVRWFESKIVKTTFNNEAARGNTVYIFLDEIQDIPDWNAQIKHLVDISACRIFITGSSALRILAGKESLAGRVQWNEINTLGLSEIRTLRGLGPATDTRCLKAETLKDKDFWIELRKKDRDDQDEQVYRLFCDLGGYPFCHAGNPGPEDVMEYLQETVVARTIVLDLKANFESMLGGSTSFMDATLLTGAFKTFCKYTGRDVSIDKLREELNAAHSFNLKHDQIRKILDFFELSMLVKVVRPFEHRLKNPKENVKICLCDHAIRGAWMKEEIPLYGSNVNSDLAGPVIEGIVGTLFKSVRHLGVSYFPPRGRGKDAEGEVDFILEAGVYHIPVEVKYKNNPDLGAGMKSFLEKKAYHAPFGLVVTKDEAPLDLFSEKGDIIPISAKQLLLLK